MNSDFKNRMAAQRKVLNIVNANNKKSEELFGLSANALNRWSRINGISDDSEVVQILNKIAQTLLFLATKSQEQVTGVHITLSIKVESLIKDLEKTMDENTQEMEFFNL